MVTRCLSFIVLYGALSWGTVVVAETSSLRTTEETVRKGDIRDLEQLLQKSDGKAASQRFGAGATPLHLAAALNQRTKVGLLLCSAAKVDARTDAGFTALHWAAREDAASAAQLLIDFGADVDATASNGITPLHWAASRNATNMVLALLTAGASPYRQTDAGMTPLDWAVMGGLNEAAYVLAHKQASDELAAEATGADVAPQPDEAEAAGDKTVSLSQKSVPGKSFTVPMGLNQDLEFVWIAALRMWVGKYEVTNGQYRRFRPRHRSLVPGRLSLDEDDQPVVRVSWLDAKAYGSWLNSQVGDQLAPGYEVRLPKAREWTLFARCGDERSYPWGDQWPPPYGNFCDESSRKIMGTKRGLKAYDDGFPVTCPVAKSGCNEWGIYGLAGNVWEWCEDWYDSHKQHRVRRGGSWDFDEQEDLTIDLWGFDRPDASYDTIGFRLVVTAKEIPSRP